MTRPSWKPGDELAPDQTLKHLLNADEAVEGVEPLSSLLELARVTAPGGSVVFSFSGGAETPIYVPFERLRSELGRRGFTEFADFSVGRGTSLVAKKR